MNKQEAIELLQEMAEESHKITKIHAVYIDSIVEIINQIDEPQKVTIPEFVAEWIKSQKESFSYASAIDMYENLTSGNRGGYYHEVWLWVIAHHYDFIKAWHDGYTVEQEKLYTVEIPDPNSYYNYRFLSRNGKGVCIDASNDNYWKQRRETHITESEIKQDFEWAFQFAKPVEENRIEDKEKAEKLIDSYKYAIELLKKAEVE